MNPDMLVYVVGLATFGIGIAGTAWLAHCDRLNLRDAHEAELADLTAIHAQRYADTEADHAAETARWVETLGRVIGDLERARLDAEWAAVVLAVTEAERDTFKTAFRGEMTRQVRAELLRPEEQAGTASVIEFPKRAQS